MPSKRRDAAQPTVYLDNSTLCDAFKAKRFNGSAHYQELFAWVESIAPRVNLCLCLNGHLGDLAPWADLETADAMAAWYDAMPIVWVRSFSDVWEAEDNDAVMLALTGKRRPVNPYGPSMMVAFHELTADAASQLLGANAVPKASRALRTSGKANEAREWMVSMVPIVYADRRDHRHLSDAQKTNIIATKHYEQLDDKAKSALMRLQRIGAIAIGAFSPKEAASRLRASFDADPTLLPSWRLSTDVSASVLEAMSRKPTLSAKVRKDFSGTFFDYVHAAVGAAYCDVFTCDAKIAPAVQPLAELFCVHQRFASVNILAVRRASFAT